MITITFNVTPADFEEARIRSRPQRVIKIVAAVFAGLLGLLFAYAEINLFRGWPLFWKHWVANLFAWTLAAFFVWLAMDTIGLNWFLRRYTKVFAAREYSFTGDMITIASAGTKHTLRWRRDRGWTETPNLFLLPIHGSDYQFILPKRAFAPGQEEDFRAFLNAPPDETRFVFDFFLTEADVEEVSRATRTWLSTPPARFAMRVFCGLGAMFVLLAPGLGLFRDVHGGWAGMWESDPLSTVFLATYCLLWLWVAAGQFGLRPLVRYLNHYEQRRIYAITNTNISLTRGEKTKNRSWKHVWNFRETPNAFILQTQSVVNYIIPKSALRSADVEEFRSFLLTKLVSVTEKLRPRNKC